MVNQHHYLSVHWCKKWSLLLPHHIQKVTLAEDSYPTLQMTGKKNSHPFPIAFSSFSPKMAEKKKMIWIMRYEKFMYKTLSTCQSFFIQKIIGKTLLFNHLTRETLLLIVEAWMTADKKDTVCWYFQVLFENSKYRIIWNSLDYGDTVCRFYAANVMSSSSKICTNDNNFQAAAKIGKTPFSQTKKNDAFYGINLQPFNYFIQQVWKLLERRSRPTFSARSTGLTCVCIRC